VQLAATILRDVVVAIAVFRPVKIGARTPCCEPDNPLPDLIPVRLGWLALTTAACRS
jgi:hypothetical protein